MDKHIKVVAFADDPTRLRPSHSSEMRPAPPRAS